MGLELFELEMEIEQEFGIKIHEDEYVELTDMGAILQMILRHLQIDSASSPAYPNVRKFESFFSVRNLILEFTSLPRNQIKLKTRVHDLIPKENRRAFWKKLQRTAGYNSPFKPLTIGFVIGFGLLMISLIFAHMAFSFILAVAINIETGVILFVVVGLIVLPLLGNLLYETLRTYDTRRKLTVKEVVTDSKLASWRQEQQSGNLWRHATPDQVWEKLVEITAEIVDESPEEIKRVSRPIEDLKMG